MKNNALDKVQFWREDELGVVAIDNGKDNALTEEVIDQLSAAVAIAESDAKVKVLCLTGSGPFFFSVGVSWNAVRHSSLLEKTHALASLLLAARIPTVSLIQAPALGAGVELSLLTDYRVASDKAVIFFPEAAHGFHTVFSGHYLCSRFCGASISRKIFMLGEMFTAEAALNVGLVDEVFASSTFYERAAEFARGAAQKLGFSNTIRQSFLEPTQLRLSFLQEVIAAESFGQRPSKLDELEDERAKLRKMITGSNSPASRQARRSSLK
jgi:enoyl-CoA hydratase/carnithine racemase